MNSKVLSISNWRIAGNSHTLLQEIALASLLPILLAVFPHSVLAVDGADGLASTGNVVLDDFPAWTTILSRDVNLAAGNHQCVAMASTNAVNPGGNDDEQLYDFVVSRNNSNPSSPGASKRTIDLADVGGQADPNVWPVATNIFESVPAGNHKFRFLGREREAGNRNMTVNHSALSVVCFQGAPL
ncbi:MAG: hypothetical protein M3436_16310 [Pseudomonadota bacterium]|nr:hypothetical protein [Pseudomonadota bacterium]